MKIIKLNNKGFVTPQDQSYFGGKYSLLERIRLKGIGSPKIVYESGIPHFDELNTFVENEMPFANFELMKNGLLIRLNRNQVLRYVGLTLDEVLRVRMTGQQVEHTSLANGLSNTRYPYQGRLVVQPMEGEQIVFTVAPLDFKSIVQYFQKAAFADKFVLDYEQN